MQLSPLQLTIVPPSPSLLILLGLLRAAVALDQEEEVRIAMIVLLDSVVCYPPVSNIISAKSLCL